MSIQNITELVEISAPAEAVFRLVASPDRRFQLHPSWGTEKVGGFSTGFPGVGSRYHSRPLAEERQPYDTVVTGYQPNQTFAYESGDERQTRARWTVQDLGETSRLTYEAEFCALETDDEEQRQALEQDIRQWLGDIKRYLELEKSRPGRALKWFLDTAFLKQRADQRRIILALLALQLVSMITFIAAALGIGMARLIFG